jgi:hypothetical protein
MWDIDVSVERERFVNAAPEKVWELAGDVTGLSLGPGRFAFPVPGNVPETDRLSCLLALNRDGTRCVVVDVREEIPGQLISWQTRNTKPVGKNVYTLSVRPERSGCIVRVAAEAHVVTRDFKVAQEMILRRLVKTWLSNLRAVAEDRAPRPQREMTAAMRQALTNPAPPRKPVQVSATVVIAGAPATVWATIRDPARSLYPESAVAEGHVPGTPQGEVGEFQYAIRRRPDGRFVVFVHEITELIEERRAVTRSIGSARAEMIYLLAPAPQGTQLELIFRWPKRTPRGRASTDKTLKQVSTALREDAEQYRALVEQPPANSSS